jgi:hypothetical protein
LDGVRRPLSFAVGVLLVLFGALFTLQGVGVVSGSFMSNTTTWSILGPVIVVVGLGLIYRGTRPARGPDDR